MTMEDKVNEMYADVKVLVSEFKTMNGSLRETKYELENHKKDSVEYRRKVDMLWSIVHSMKWLIVFLFGTGVLFKFVKGS